MFSWPALMTNWVKVGFENSANLWDAADAVTAATPLAAMHQGQMPAESLLDMFLGNVGGSLGETSALLLLIGFVYLLIRRVITIRIPLAYIGTVAVLTVLFPRSGDPLQWMTAQLCTGGLMLGAIFMATDYVTSPATAWGKVHFGLGAGLLTFLIRYYGVYPEGVSFAILFMNILTPYIEKLTAHKVFGTKIENS